ncbi:MAG: YbhB/YbcL family Raf kinase inhibitor-like protein, partial [Actinomycetes bacterium]
MAGIELRSPSFSDHQPIPARHAKDHDNLSPTLEWSGVPRPAVELAVLCEDPDAPAAPSATGCSPAWSRPRPAWLKASARPQPSRAATTSARKARAAPFAPVGDDPHWYVFRVL